MNRFIKSFNIISLGFLLLILSTRVVSAQVVINEFGSYETSGDWVELYAYEDTEISGWIIRDTTSIVETISTGVTIGPSSSSYYVVEVGNRLNRNGDVIKLLKADDSTLVNEIVYGDAGGVCSPESGQSAGRYPDANSTIERFSSPTKGSSNDAATLAPCSTPTTEPTVTETPAPTAASSATLKVKEVKNEDGEILSNVKIYIDSVYTHHYAPEDFTFCEDCKCIKCDNQIDLKFGSYTVKLEKGGYKDWSETKDIQSGNTVEIDAVLKKEDTSTNTPTVTKKPTSTPTKKETIKSAKTTNQPMIGSEGEINIDDENLVLGINEEIGIENLENQEGVSDKGGKIPLTAGVFIAGGLVLVTAAAYPSFKTKLLAWRMKGETKNESEIS